MSELIDVKHDLKQFKGSMKKMDAGIRDALRHSVNRASQQAKTAAARKIRERYVVKHGAVLKQLGFSRAARKTARAELKAKGYVIPLIEFGGPKRITKRKMKFVKVKVLRQGGKLAYRGAFIQLSRSWKEENRRLGVFMRKGTKRYPIKELYGPSIPSMLAHPEVKEAAREVYGETMLKRVPHELNRALGRLKV